MEYPIEKVDFDRGPEVIWDVVWYGHGYRVERTDASGQREGKNDDSDLFLFYIDDKLVDSKKVTEYKDEWEAIGSLMTSSPKWIHRREVEGQQKGGKVN